MNKGIGLEVDKSIEALAKVNINNAVIAARVTTETKAEWQIAIEQRLDALSAENAALNSEVTQLQHALATQAEACRQHQEGGGVVRNYIDDCLKESIELNCHPGGLIWNAFSRR